jgi:hypothetical protein
MLPGYRFRVAKSSSECEHAGATGAALSRKAVERLDASFPFFA